MSADSVIHVTPEAPSSRQTVPARDVLSLPRTPFDPLGLLRRRLRLLVLAAAIALPLSVVHALLAPRWYSSHITLVPVDGSKRSALADLPIDIDTGPSTSDRLADVIKSRSVAAAVLAGTTADPDEALGSLWEHCSLDVGKRSAFLTLTCEARDPRTARDVLARFVQAAEETWHRVSGGSASDERRFLEKRVAEARRDVDEASRKLREFQEQHKLVDLSEQSRASLTALASLQGDLISKQMQLEYLSAFSAKDEPTAVQLKQQIAVMKERLGSLEGVQKPPGGAPFPPAPEAASGMLPPLLDVPRLRYEYEQLYRDQQVQETVFLLLTRLFEVAKVNEARDTSAFQVLDPPIVAAHKSRPREMTIVATDTGIAMALVAAWILLPAWWRSYRAATAAKASGEGTVASA